MVCVICSGPIKLHLWAKNFDKCDLVIVGSPSSQIAHGYKNHVTHKHGAYMDHGEEPQQHKCSLLGGETGGGVKFVEEWCKNISVEKEMMYNLEIQREGERPADKIGWRSSSPPYEICIIDKHW